MVDEVVEERRREVERRDPLGLDQGQRLTRVPAGLRDEAAADEVHRDERVDPHRVVERHHPERAVAPGVAVLERLRPPARSVGGVRARNALRPAGRPGRVEHQRDLALVAVERALVLGTIGKAVGVADDEPRTAVGEAVVELVLGQPPGERHEHRSGPLGGPVEERGVEPVVEHGRHALSGPDAETAGHPPEARQELAVREAGERLELGMALAGREERLREVHGAPPGACVGSAQASIASTIGA